MSKNIGNFLHRRTGPEQTTGDAVPKNMGTCPAFPPTAFGIRSADGKAHNTGTNRFVEGSDMPQKKRAAAGHRTSVLQVGGNRPSGLWRQWQHVFPSRLGSGQPQCAFTPVNIVQL